MKKLNCRGGDRIISIYWFFILFLVAGAIAYMAASFYGKPYDVRDAELRILSNKIADCVSSGGYINENILEDNNVNENFEKDFLKRCKLNFDVEDYQNWQDDQFFVLVQFYEFDDTKGDLLGEFVNETSVGNINLRGLCNMDGKNFPICFNRMFYTLDKENHEYIIKILSVVRKTEKNE